EAEGYRVETVRDVGPFVDLRLQDTPYSFSILSQDFIQNTQANLTPGIGLLEKSPLFASINSDAARGQTKPGSQRGINNNAELHSTYFLVDGTPAGVLNATDVFGNEEYERVEILSGVSGFLYGVNSSGGFANYITKRPTPTPYYSVTLGAPDLAGGYIHADLG